MINPSFSRNLVNKREFYLFYLNFKGYSGLRKKEEFEIIGLQVNSPIIRKSWIEVNQVFSFDPFVH